MKINQNKLFKPGTAMDETKFLKIRKKTFQLAQSAN